MTGKQFTAPQPAIGALLASGFPFQTAIARIARQARGCEVTCEEFPWQDAGGQDRFCDIVARKHRFIVTIECKKTRKDILTFLQPGGVDDDVNRARCLYLTQIPDSTKRMELFCSDWMLLPKSTESKFCVVSTGDSGKDPRLLERDAQLLIRGTEAYARRLKADFKVQHVPEPDLPIIPLIVTNAELFVADFDAADVSLGTGQLSAPSLAKLLPVPWVRFRKTFTTAGKDLGDRTVFVARAGELEKWLASLEFAGAGAPAPDGKTHFE